MNDIIQDMDHRSSALSTHLTSAPPLKTREFALKISEIPYQILGSIPKRTSTSIHKQLRYG